MKHLLLPYGKGKIQLTIEDGHLAAVLRSGIGEYRPTASACELVREAIEHPVGSPRLRELSAGGITPEKTGEVFRGVRVK